MSSTQKTLGHCDPSRRDFLKIIPATGTALLMMGCTTAPAPSQQLNTALPMKTDTDTPPSVETQTPSASLTTAPEHLPSLTSPSPSDYLSTWDHTMTKIPLPDARTSLTTSLVQALQERHSSRDFRPDDIPLSLISAILWAGFGINRPDGKRTAPSAYNLQDIDIYLATHTGLYKYLAVDHALLLLTPADLRQYTGSQEFVARAPLNLIYVSDYNRLKASSIDSLQWSWAHTGFISQNIYLACAALGFATVVRSTLDRINLSSQMGLAPHQNITLAQTIGYPT